MMVGFQAVSTTQKSWNVFQIDELLQVNSYSICSRLSLVKLAESSRNSAMAEGSAVI
jgi:hypothetical protein